MSTMAPDIEKKYYKPQNLKIPIDPKNPVPWPEIVDKVEPIFRRARGFPDASMSDIWDLPLQETVRGSNTSIRFDLMSLPRELFLDIFDLMMEPYELKVCLTKFESNDNNDDDESTNFTDMIIHNPRTWASMSLFQISRQFRSLAIKYYGEPREDSLPFSPAIDKLVILGVDHFCRGSPLQPIASIAKRVDARFLRRLHQESVMPYGLLCYYNKLHPTNTHAHLTLLGKELLERVQHLDIRYIDSSQIFWCNMDWWVCPLRDLTASLPNIKHFEVSIHRYNPFRIGPPQNRWWDGMDRLLLRGIERYTDKVDPSHPRLFPQLESFEITMKVR